MLSGSSLHKGHTLWEIRPILANLSLVISLPLIPNHTMNECLRKCLLNHTMLCQLTLSFLLLMISHADLIVNLPLVLGDHVKTSSPPIGQQGRASFISIRWQELVVGHFHPCSSMTSFTKAFLGIPES